MAEIKNSKLKNSKTTEKILSLDHIEEKIYNDSFYVAHFPEKFPVYNQPHRHSFYEILFFVKGNGTQYIDGTEYSFSGNDVFIISEDQVHYVDDNPDINGYLICFKDDFWHTSSEIKNYKTSLFNNLSINSHIKLSEDQTTEFYEFLDNIRKEYELPDYENKTEVLNAYLKIFLIKLDNLKNNLGFNKVADGDLTIFQSFIEKLEQSFRKIHEVSAYSDLLRINKRKLTEICKKYSGKTPKELIDKRIMTESSRLLQFTSSSIKEIAGQLGFADQYHFSKFFKKHTLLSPVDFRNKW